MNMCTYVYVYISMQNNTKKINNTKKRIIQRKLLLREEFDAGNKELANY